MKKETIDMIKLGVGLATGFGAASIIGSACSAVAGDVKGIKKICCILGASAMAGIVSDKAGEYMENVVDDTLEMVTDGVNAWHGKTTEDKEVVEE